MTKLQSFASIYRTFAEAWLSGIEDESGRDHLTAFFGPADVDGDDYTWVQREFGWDDTH